MIRTCEKDSEGMMAKNYAGMEAKRDKSAKTSIPQMEATFKLRNEGKVP